MHPYLWILDDDGNPVPCDDLIVWGRRFESAQRSVARTPLILRDLEIEVSTVFLGIDHSFGDDGPPVLWETMVFGLGDFGAEHQRRHCSREEAGHYHGEVVADLLKRGARLLVEGE